MTDITSKDSSSPASVNCGGGGYGAGCNIPLPRPAWTLGLRGEPESSSSSVTLGAAVAAAPWSPSLSSPVGSATSASEQAAGLSSCLPDCPALTAPVGSSGAYSNANGESSVDCNGNGSPAGRPAWNRPVNGVIEPVSVMGDTMAWPALSESTKSVPRLMTESSRPTSDGSTSCTQGSIGNQSPHRQANANANSNANTNANHAMPGRPRSLRHRGGGNNNNAGGGLGQGGFSRATPPPPPMPPPFPVLEIPYGNILPPVVMDSSVRGPRPMGGLGPQTHAPNDHSPQRNSSRRGNFGPRPRGDGSYHNHHGGRRDQDRRDIHDRRDVHLPQFLPPAFMPPPSTGTPPPYGTLPVRPFPAPMGFDMASPFLYVPPLSLESFRGVPLVAQAPPSPMFYPAMLPNLPAIIVHQIDYYFSDDNLVKDDYLRSNMDHEGWVPISLIANFPRVAQLTSNIQFILESLRASTVVEVQADKVRKRNDWTKWVATSARHNSDSADASVENILAASTSARHNSDSADASVENILATSVQAVSLDEATSSRDNTADAVNARTDTNSNRFSFGEFTGQSTLANREGAPDESSRNSSALVA